MIDVTYGFIAFTSKAPADARRDGAPPHSHRPHGSPARSTQTRLQSSCNNVARRDALQSSLVAPVDVVRSMERTGDCGCVKGRGCADAVARPLPAPRRPRPGVAAGRVPGAAGGGTRKRSEAEGRAAAVADTFPISAFRDRHTANHAANETHKRAHPHRTAHTAVLCLWTPKTTSTAWRTDRSVKAFV